MIYKVKKNEYPALLLVWESSVKATHHFLKDDHFNFYKEQIPAFFDDVMLYCLKDENTDIVGFIGTANENLEMLFVKADAIGKGFGKKLLSYALDDLKITKVDVNEENTQAIRFYEHFGFQIQSISQTDGFGKPYPILHMQLK